MSVVEDHVGGTQAAKFSLSDRSASEPASAHKTISVAPVCGS